MNDVSQENGATVARLLGRSLFPMVVIATLCSLIVGIFVINFQTRDSIRPVLIASYALLLVAAFVLCGVILRTSEDALAKRLEPLVRAIGRPILAAVLIIGIFEFDLIVYILISGIAHNLLPLVATLIIWSALLIISSIIATSITVGTWLAKTRTFWSSIGLTLVVFSIAAGCAVLTNLLLDSIIDPIRGASDFRVLVFHDSDDNVRQSQAYWSELGELHAAWLPYTYHHFAPHTGKYINITAAGLRETNDPLAPDADAPSIYFFGGSTIWGEGSRDAYTIPSQVAAQLDDSGSSAHVFNYGQVAYVSTQDLILFQRQLALGNIPDVAVFYGGFNDMVSVEFYNGIAGLPHNETDRLKDWITGQTLRRGHPVILQPNVSMNDIDVSLVAAEDATPEQIVDLYLNNVRLIRASASEFGVRTLFVWQPGLHYKVNLTPEERLLREDNQRSYPGFEALYTQVDTLLRERIADEGLTDLLDLSQMFADTTDYVFFDRVHVVEDGNIRIALAILPMLRPLLIVLS